MAYDSSNVFAKILRGEIPNKTVYESEHTLAFYDIMPQAPIHVLVIPKGAYVDFADFSANAPNIEIIDFYRSCAKICTELKLTSSNGSKGGFRAITNSGAYGLQEVPHYHLHLLGGRVLGPLLCHHTTE